MVISRSGPPSSRRCDFMATTAKPPPHGSSSTSPHPSSTAPTTSTKRHPQQPQPQPHPHQQPRGVAQGHQSSLHDFSFPVLKTWGRQRLLRCAKVPPDHNDGAGAASGGVYAGGNGLSAGSGGGFPGGVGYRRFAAPHPAPPRTKVAKVKDDGLERIREKLMGHLRAAAGRMELKARPVPVPAARRQEPPPMSDDEEEDEDEDDDEEEEDDDDDEEYPDVPVRPPAAAAAAAAVAAPPAPPSAPLEEEKPWKLRTRRSAYSKPRTPDHPKRRRDSSPSPAVSSPHRGSPPGAAASANPVPVPVPPPPSRPLRSRPAAPYAPEDQDPATEEDQQQRAAPPRRQRQQPPRQQQQQNRRKPFSVTLSKDEIEEDVYALTGRRASRRPKKRPRTLRRQLDMLFPGYYLTEAVPSLYEVREPPRES